MPESNSKSSIPWKYPATRDQHESGNYIIHSWEGHRVAMALYLGGTAQACTNAEFIVRAVNSHQALVDALRGLLHGTMSSARASAALKLAEVPE